MTLFEKLNKDVIFFDGGLGSLLIAKGVTTDEPPEFLNITAPEALIDIHLSYLNAGSDIITTNTFGANAIKLHSDMYTLSEVITAAIKNAKSAVEKSGKNALVAFGMGPTGKLLEPMGELKFDDAVAAYTEAASIAEKAGADLIIIETMTDTYEMKAAVLGAKEASDLPIIATF
ncbi:MAG TPA: homocysteine S-methyltransferase family protein, partial [Clostridiales bacterium]|nr:homocysteine S-methyltransferase family protein [Clostridiales bacterium]